MKRLVFVILLALSSNVSAEICDSIFKTNSIGCQDLSGSHSSGGSYPLLFDALNFSPSALPTFPTPYGVEAFYHEKKINVAVIKGIENVGFGAALKNTDTTYFSGVENYKVAVKESNADYKPSSLENIINLGSAVSLIDLPDLANVAFGLNYRINPSKGIYSFQPGVDLRTEYLTLAASFYREKPKVYNDGFFDVKEERENVNFTAGLRFQYVLADYTMLKQKNSSSLSYGGGVVANSVTEYTVSTHIVSGTFVYEQLSLTGAYRLQNDSRLNANYSINSGQVNENYKKSHVLAGASYKTPVVEIGVFYNYVLTNDLSILLKIFF